MKALIFRLSLDLGFILNLSRAIKGCLREGACQELDDLYTWSIKATIALALPYRWTRKQLDPMRSVFLLIAANHNCVFVPKLLFRTNTISTLIILSCSSTNTAKHYLNLFAYSFGNHTAPMTLFN